MTEPPEPPEPMFTTGPLRVRGPVPRHRGREPLRLGSLLVGLVLLVAVVAAGGAVSAGNLTEPERYAEFVVTGALGRPVTAAGLDVTVRGVRTAGVITDRPGGRYSTAGVWVLVSVRVAARQEPTTIEYAAVRDSSGRFWDPTGRIPQPLLEIYQLQPGIPVEAEIVFEVPPDAATDLWLRLSESSAINHLQYATVAEVALPVGEQPVQQARADADREADDELDLAEKPEPVQVAQPQVVLAEPPVVSAGPGGRWLEGE